MELQEKAMQYVEGQIPLLAPQAARQAFWATLAMGESVMIAEAGKLWEVAPDGSRRFVKDILPPVTVSRQHYRIPAR
jgi:uncharacterized protein YjeT (DUF2065 family)